MKTTVNKLYKALYNFASWNTAKTTVNCSRFEISQLSLSSIVRNKASINRNSQVNGLEKIYVLPMEHASNKTIHSILLEILAQHLPPLNHK